MGVGYMGQGLKDVWSCNWKPLLWMLPLLSWCMGVLGVRGAPTRALEWMNLFEVPQLLKRTMVSANTVI